MILKGYNLSDYSNLAGYQTCLGRIHWWFSGVAWTTFGVLGFWLKCWKISCGYLKTAPNEPLFGYPASKPVSVKLFSIHQTWKVLTLLQTFFYEDKFFEFTATPGFPQISLYFKELSNNSGQYESMYLSI